MKYYAREHQLKALNAMKLHRKGKVISPTASGKSLIQALDIINSIKEHGEKVPKVYVILSHRIILTVQLLREVYTQMMCNNIFSLYLNVSSGKIDEEPFIDCLKYLDMGNEYYSAIESSLDVNTIKEKYQDAKNLGCPLIISGTYHSADKIAMAEIPIEVIYYDEAHFLATKEYNNVVDFMTHGKRHYFFTATPKSTNSEDGYGMNNEMKFGKTIFNETPANLMAKGEIVGPNLHIVKTEKWWFEEKQDSNPKAYMRLIDNAFKQHCKLLEKTSSRPELLGGKMLVTLEGQMVLKSILESKDFRTFCDENQDIKVFAISTDIGAYINGDLRQSGGDSKAIFYDNIKKLKPDEKAIIIHVDMLSEGIDVPGITGIMPFRNMCYDKILQNIGRATRLHPEDRKKLYSGEIQPMDLDKYVKRYAWIIIPYVLSYSADFKERVLGMLVRVWGDYDYIFNDLVIDDQLIGLGGQTMLDYISGKDKRAMSKKFETEIVHVIQNEYNLRKLIKCRERLKEMSKDERLSLYSQVMKSTYDEIK